MQKRSRVLRKFSTESGQALVLVLLSLAVVLTLVLFVLSRTITDISVSSTNEESVRAFSAAEAGIEQSLIVGSSSTNSDLGNGASFSANVSDFAAGTTQYTYPINLSYGDSATVWFVDHDTDDNLICDATHSCFTGTDMKVCWGNPETSGTSTATPAIEVSVFYKTNPASGDFSTLQIARIPVDPYTQRSTTSVDGASANNFTGTDGVTCTIDGETFQFQKTFTFSSLGIPLASYGSQNGLQFARVRMLYNTDQSHKVGFSVTPIGGSTLPSQGVTIDSAGRAGTSNRRIEVFQSWPTIPSVFEYALFSPPGLAK